MNDASSQFVPIWLGFDDCRDDGCVATLGINPALRDCIEPQRSRFGVFMMGDENVPSVAKLLLTWDAITITVHLRAGAVLQDLGRIRA